LRLGLLEPGDRLPTAQQVVARLAIAATDTSGRWCTARPGGAPPSGSITLLRLVLIV
jgi:hypothetical protein